MILINPFSGSGKAPNKFKKKVQPILQEAGITHQVITTNYKNGAQDLIKDLTDIYHWDGIVVVSGDGLLFEVFNGLMLRDDWQKAIQIPVGIIPAGSGNGLAATLDFKTSSNDTPDPITSGALNAVFGKPCPVDLVEVSLPRQKVYSFLSVGWGLISDIDIESEGLRFIGDSRFVLWSIYRSFVPKTYRGRLSYLPVDNKTLTNLKKHGSDTIEIEVKQTGDNNVTNSSAKRHEEPSNDTHNDSGNVGGENDDACSSPSPNQNDYIPPLWEAVPSNWTTIEDDFIMIQSASQSHLSPTVHFAPHSELADGIIWLAYITSKVSIKNLLRFLSSLESARHIDLPYVKIIPVRAFRLEPLTSGGTLSIDGEAFDSQPCQVQILPSMGKIFIRDADQIS